MARARSIAPLADGGVGERAERDAEPLEQRRRPSAVLGRVPQAARGEDR